MWRYILSFVAVSLLTSVILAVIFPTEDLIEDLLIIGCGFIAIFFLGNEIFLHALLPTEGETRGINRILETSPKWNQRLVYIGTISGFVSSASFFIVAEKSESFFVALIPIGIFFVCVLFLQYILPKLLPESASCVHDSGIDTRVADRADRGDQNDDND